MLIDHNRTNNQSGGNYKLKYDQCFSEIFDLLIPKLMITQVEQASLFDASKTWFGTPLILDMSSGKGREDTK